MTAKSRRRRDSNAPRPELSRKEPAPRRRPESALAGTGIPEWNWKTTPVLLAFAIGGLIGTYLGALANASDNLYAVVVISGIFALLLGSALGRVLRRWLAIRRIGRIRAG
jgi:hypothetical protein